IPGVTDRPSIRVTGLEGGNGYLGTRNEYENYSLLVWWKWGERNYPGDRADKRRWAGVLLHITGPDEQLGGSPMPQSVVGHFREGQIGNIRPYGLEGTIRCNASVKRSPDRVDRVYDESEPPTQQVCPVSFPAPPPGKWDGTIHRLGYVPGKVEDDPEPAGK